MGYQKMPSNAFTVLCILTHCSSSILSVETSPGLRFNQEVFVQ